MLGRFIKGPSEPRAEQPPRDCTEIQCAASAPAVPAPDVAAHGDDFLTLKVELHRHLIDRFNLTALETASKDEILNEIRPIVREFVRARNVPLNARELDQLTSDTADEMLGLGPIEPLLKDDSIADILINTHKQVFIERRGAARGDRRSASSDEAHLLRIINKIVSAVGRRVDESSPMVDARLPDGSRVNIAVRPIAVDGPLVSIRKFSKKPYSLERLIEFNSHPPADGRSAARPPCRRANRSWFRAAPAAARRPCSTRCRATSPSNERLITIEDAAELQLQQPHVGRLETRPPNVEGKGEVRQRELVKNALRMRPDRIIVGEVSRRGSLRHAAGDEHRP